MTETTSTQTRAEKLISFLIAGMAILAAVITTLQTYAAGKGNQAERLSSQYAIQAMQAKASGQTRVSHDRQGAYQAWYELDLQALGADLAGDTAAAARYRAVRDHIATLSPIFAAPYFDAASGFGPDMSRYESDVYVVESARLSEKFAAYNELGNAWDNRANTLNAKYPSHNYPILMEEARRIGLKADTMPAAVNTLLLELNEIYSEMGQRATTDFDPTHSHSNEILNIWESGGIQTHYKQDKDWFYRMEERRWITLNDNSAWHRLEQVDGKTVESILHIA